MAQRGRPPKNPKLESAQGFPGRRKQKTKAVLAAIADADDIQDDSRDSRFVQPPPSLIGKAARVIWAEIMSCPNARAWYKRSDHNILVLYVHALLQYRQIMKSPPASTYEVPQIVDGKVVGYVRRANPEFTAQITLCREIREIQKVIGANPSARIGLEKAGLAKPPEPDPADGSKLIGKSSGPIGILKSPHKMN